MTAAQIGKVWTVLSLILLYYALNSWIVSQGGSEIFGAKLVISTRFPAAVVAIPICSILLLVSSIVGKLYASRSSPEWHRRIPVVGFDAINTASIEGRIYQGAILFFLSILPSLSLVHFWHILLNAKIVTRADNPIEIGSIWDWSKLNTLNDPARICTIFRREDYSCEGNISFLPGLEPIIFAIVTGAGVMALTLFLAEIFKHPREDLSLI